MAIHEDGNAQQLEVIESNNRSVKELTIAYETNGFKGIMPMDDKDYMLDSIFIGGEDSDFSYAQAFKDVVDNSLNKDPESVARALLHVKPHFNNIQDDYLSDSLGGLNGFEIVPQLIIMDFAMQLNSSVPELVGNIPMDREKLAMYAMSWNVFQASGNLQEGEEIKTLNMQQPFAIKGRHEKFIATGGDDKFEMRLYHRITDDFDDTAKVAHNKTRVSFYGYNEELNDFEVSVGQKTCNPTTEINGKEVKLTINYADGKIMVDVTAGALEEGDIIIVESSIDIKDNIEANRALTIPKITPIKYVPYPLTIGVEVFKFDAETVRRNTGMDMLGATNLFNLQKTIEEVGFAHLSKAYMIAKKWHRTLDLTQNANTHNADIYKHLSAEIREISNKIGENTGWTSSAILIGGGALTKALELSDSPTRNGVLSGIEAKGLLNNTWKSYYNPSHDSYLPLVDKDGNENVDTTLNVYSQILVVGYGKEQIHRAILGGLPNELRSEYIPYEKDSTEFRAIEGTYVSQINNAPSANGMVYKLLVKGIITE